MQIKGIIMSGIEVAKIVDYTCIKCGERKSPIEFRPNMQDATLKLFCEAVAEQLCLDCLTGTDKAVAGAAENLRGLLQ